MIFYLSFVKDEGLTDFVAWAESWDQHEIRRRFSTCLSWFPFSLLGDRQLRVYQA